MVLAAGDYANSAAMISRFKGPQFACVEGINPYSTGDGHRLAEEAGATLVNMDVTYGPEIRFIPPPRKPFTQLLPARGPVAWIMGLGLPFVPKWIINQMIKRLLVTWQHPENALFDDGAILVNQRGERFCNECSSPEREIAIARQPEKIAYLLLDGRLAERYSKWPHFVSTAPEVAYALVQDYRRMRPDVTADGRQLGGGRRRTQTAGRRTSGDRRAVQPIRARRGGRSTGPIPLRAAAGRRGLGAARSGQGLLHHHRGCPGDQHQHAGPRRRRQTHPRAYTPWARTAWAEWCSGGTVCTLPGRSPAAAWWVKCWRKRNARNAHKVQNIPDAIHFRIVATAQCRCEPLAA